MKKGPATTMIHAIVSFTDIMEVLAKVNVVNRAHLPDWYHHARDFWENRLLYSAYTSKIKKKMRKL